MKNITSSMFIAFILFSVVGVQEYQYCITDSQCVFNPNYSLGERSMIQFLLPHYSQYVRFVHYDGNWGTYGTYNRDGYMTYIKLFNYPLSASEVAELHANYVFEDVVIW
jgi:hypothetical protein